MAVQIKEKVQGSLGYSFGDTVEFSVSKNSAQLEVGEYVKAYYAKVYDVTPVYQTDNQHTTGWQLVSGKYEYVDYYNTERTTAYAKEAILPQIKFEYYSVPMFYSLDDTNNCIRTEIYEYIDGDYQLVYTTNGYMEAINERED